MSELRDQVQAMRDSAREQLRMVMIENELQSRFEIEKNLNSANKMLEQNAHLQAVANYKLTKLDELDPDFQTKKEVQEEALKDLAQQKENLEKEAARYQAELDKSDEQITKIESGEVKVSIEEVDELVKKKILTV